MSRHAALALLLLLAACHRGKVADVTLEADRAAENATAAKTVADIAAADQAASTALPLRRPAAATAESPSPRDAEVAPLTVGEGNREDAAPE